MSRTMHPQSPAVTSYWRNCAEGVWWPCYIRSDIWLQDYFWKASSLGFQSSFSKAWYLEEIPASISCYTASWEMLSGFCPASFGVLFSSVVHGSRYTHSVVPVSLQGVCLSVTLHIVDLWRYYVCCTRSGVTWCPLFISLYQSRMCRCVLHPVM